MSLNNLFRLVAVSTALLILSTIVKADSFVTGEPLPFHPDPESFAKWLSGQTFSGPAHSGGGKYEFFQLRDCKLGTVLGPNAITSGHSVIYSDSRENPYSYRCEMGYLKETSPLGVKVCRIKYPQHQTPFQIKGYKPAERETRFGWGECRWLTGVSENSPSLVK